MSRLLVQLHTQNCNMVSYEESKAPNAEHGEVKLPKELSLLGRLQMRVGIPYERSELYEIRTKHNMSFVQRAH